MTNNLVSKVMGCCSSSTAVKVVATEWKKKDVLEELDGIIINDITIIIMVIIINAIINIITIVKDEEESNSTVCIERILHITADIHETYHRSKSSFGESDVNKDEVLISSSLQILAHQSGHDRRKG